MNILRQIIELLLRLFRREPSTQNDPPVEPLEPLERLDEADLTEEALADRFSAQAVETQRISHALVLPDLNFTDWYNAALPYIRAFDRVAVVRSPSGNDLNRFRNVTAVDVPGGWFNNNALDHIRRIYPSVVRVDVVKVTTPAQLGQVLQQRVGAQDRFGAQFNADNHLYDRFILEWPVDVIPGRIVRAFNADLGSGRRNEGIDIAAANGTTVRSTVSGTVALVMREQTALGYGQYVQIGTTQNGVQYVVTHAFLRDITVQQGQTIKAGDIIGKSGADAVRVVVQQPGSGQSGYVLPGVIDPVPFVYWNNLRLRPLEDRLRVREKPGTDFPIVTQVNTTDRLETLETHGRTLVKVGQNGQWLNVRAPDGKTGYSAAWFLSAVSLDILDRVKITGVNLDLMHPRGKPASNRLGGLGWVRFTYNVSYNPSNNSYGNTDVQAAYNRYFPFIEQYARAGYKVMLVITHQTFGEGAGYYWPGMNSDRWRDLTGKLASMVRVIAGQYANKNLVHAYQIWNEQDAQIGAGSSVPMPAGNYAFLLAECIRAIRTSDKSVTILTGGHTGGPANGAAYAKATITALPPGVVVDGIAHHPYGRGTKPGLPYAPFGHIDDEIKAYGAVLAGKPTWITEFGVLDRPNDPTAQVSDYATSFVNTIKQKWPGQVSAAIWYAWAQGMHNGYGLVGTDDRPRQPLYDRFLAL
jgi:murein DD-endopeptidase MepM/ murein hydrolase activator NlpD